jgi:SAM-dependent methyltransferase
MRGWQFFNLVWPDVENVTGIDIDPAVVDLARKSGVYKEVYTVSASELPFEDNSFGSIFSNCALEHMDTIEIVLQEAHRVLRPDGFFLLSVVTDRFLDWTPLPFFTEILGFPESGSKLRDEYKRYHLLRNSFPAARWNKLFQDALFVIEQEIPIVPDAIAHLFLLCDQIWHIPYQDTEVSTLLHPALLNLPNYSEGMRDILSGVYTLSAKNGEGAGIIIALKKR